MRHPVEDQVVLAIAQAISARPFLGVIEPLEIRDALPYAVELGELGIRSSYGRGGSDLAFEATEEVEEVPDLREIESGDVSMKLSKSTTAFLACHWENDVVGSDGAFAPFYRQAHAATLASFALLGEVAAADEVLDAL
jgi:hypothetical protein